MNATAYSQYLASLNFKPDDTVCVSFGKDKKWIGDYFQPFSSLNTPASVAKLKSRSEDGQNIYISMAPFARGTVSRKKEFVGGVRHVFADIDFEGQKTLERVKADVRAGILPEPAVVVESSPGKVQIIWQVSGDFDIAKQEALNRAIQQRYDTDPATVDTARVLRIPGFTNHKYAEKPEARLLAVGNLSAHRLSAFKIESATRDLKTPPIVTGDKIPRGQHDKELNRISGRLRHDGLEEEAIYNALVEVVEKRCENYGTDYLEMCRKHAHNICKKPVGKDQTVYSDGRPVGQAEIQPQTDEIIEVNDTVQIPDMPENAIPDGVLSNICRKYMDNFPRSYAWPALLTVAGVMIPLPSPSAAESLSVSVGAGSQTNLYTALIGPVGSGKTQAIQYAVSNLGLDRKRYTDTKAGSIEGLLAKLSENNYAGQKLVDLDEWSHFFKKAGIENASFVDILNSGFNKPEFHLTIAGGKRIDLTCALSLVGGMVSDKVQECFNSASIGGFHDRFLFGICPTVNPFIYYPFNPAESAQGDPFSCLSSPEPIKINKSVWELAASWKKADMSLGRSVEVTIRCCSIIASFNGQSEIRAKDLEAMRPFLDYQLSCRQSIVPTAGLTMDARMSNAILGWLKRHADGGEWVNQRSLKKGIHNMLNELGPTIFKNTLHSLGVVQAVQTKIQPNDRNKPSHLIRLIKGM